MEISEILHLSPIVPVVTIKNLEDAVPLAQALLAGGISVIEVTLRTKVALAAIKAIRENVPTAMVGAGTVLEPEQFGQAKLAGAGFIVSPGLASFLIEAAKKTGLPYLPGAVTASEIMAAKHAGFNTLKFFPAELFGGVKTLKALLPLFPEVEFCPTGGITLTNMKEYLSLKNVVAVGGTWIIPENLIETKNWEAITALTKQAIKQISS